MRERFWNTKVPLPLPIAEAEYIPAVLSVRGPGWALGTLCAWRWVNADGDVVSERTDDVETKVLGLVGDEIVGIRIFGPEPLDGDPTFVLASGGEVMLMSDETFDTWSFRAPGVNLVGP